FSESAGAILVRHLSEIFQLVAVDEFPGCVVAFHVVVVLVTRRNPTAGGSQLLDCVGGKTDVRPPVDIPVIAGGSGRCSTEFSGCEQIIHIYLANRLG